MSVNEMAIIWENGVCPNGTYLGAKSQVSSSQRTLGSILISVELAAHVKMGSSSAAGRPVLSLSKGWNDGELGRTVAK